MEAREGRARTEGTRRSSVTFDRCYKGGRMRKASAPLTSLAFAVTSLAALATLAPSTDASPANAAPASPAPASPAPVTAAPSRMRLASVPFVGPAAFTALARDVVDVVFSIDPSIAASAGLF